MRSFASALRAGQLLLGLQNGTTSSSSAVAWGTPRSCPTDTPLSCSQGDVFAAQDSCCFLAPGGQIAMTQFWNSDPSRGPSGYLGPGKSWTIHGLWPDHCDGKYDSVCDCSRSGDCSSSNRKCRQVCNRTYSSISAILQKYNQDELLEYMSRYWKGINGDEHLYQHEWSKHGTCVNTLEPKCYNSYQPAQEVVDYFSTAVHIFQALPTYDWLADAGILPDFQAHYSRDLIMKALSSARGVRPVIGCEGNQLREVWYMFSVKGSLQGGEFIPTEPNFSGTGGQPGKSCPPIVKYLPKPAEFADEL